MGRRINLSCHFGTSLCTMFIGSVYPVHAEHGLDSDRKLSRLISAERRDVKLDSGVRLLANAASSKVHVESQGTERLPIGFSFKDTSAMSALDSITIVYPQFYWVRSTSGTIELKDVNSARMAVYDNRRLLPQTPARKEVFRRGNEFLQIYNRLGKLKQILLADRNGRPFRELSAALKVATRNLLQAYLADPTIPQTRKLISIAELDHSRTRFQFTKRTGYQLYTLLIFNDSAAFPIEFNDFRGVKTADFSPPPDLAMQANERVRLLLADARFSKPITLNLRMQNLFAALRQVANKAKLSFVFDGEEKYPEPKSLLIASLPLREALDEMARAYKFEWERSEGGVLVVRKGRFEPALLARGRVENHCNDIADIYDKLSPVEKSALNTGMQLENMHGDLGASVGSMFREWFGIAPRNAFGLSGSSMRINTLRNGDGRTFYRVEATSNQGRRFSLVFGRTR